jgi:hypothetical protein
LDDQHFSLKKKIETSKKKGNAVKETIKNATAWNIEEDLLGKYEFYFCHPISFLTRPTELQEYLCPLFR